MVGSSTINMVNQDLIFLETSLLMITALIMMIIAMMMMAAMMRVVSSSRWWEMTPLVEKEADSDSI